MRVPVFFDKRTLAAVLILAAAIPGTLSGQITAAVAANVQFAMEDLKIEFQKKHPVEVKTVYSSSGKLTAQIRNGAPFDVFVSADMDYPDSLCKWGYAQGRPTAYAYGKLVLWTLKDLDLSRGLALLADSGVGRIALADPGRAPYGREAVRAMRNAGIYDGVKDKLVFGENISQVSQFLLTGNVDLCLSAKSVVLSGEMRIKGHWAEVDSSSYQVIAQGAVVCKYGLENNPGLSRQFHAFLYTEPARAIFAKYGYVLPRMP